MIIPSHTPFASLSLTRPAKTIRSFALSINSCLVCCFVSDSKPVWSPERISRCLLMAMMAQRIRGPGEARDRCGEGGECRGVRADCGDWSWSGYEGEDGCEGYDLWRGRASAPERSMGKGKRKKILIDLHLAHQLISLLTVLKSVFCWLHGAYSLPTTR